MNENEEKLLESIDNRLKWLLKLRVRDHFEEETTNKEKIKTLYNMNFSNSEMADILGISEGSVRGTISTLRKEGAIDE